MESTKKAVETLSVWAEANQRVLRELAELSTATVKESVRLYGEMAQTMVQAFGDAQAQSLRWQAAWQDAPKDPLAWYHRALSDGVDNAQKAFRVLEGNAQAMTKSAERLSTTAEQAGKGIQETFSGVVSKMKEVYAA
jgi:predicted deacylase